MDALLSSQQRIQCVERSANAVTSEEPVPVANGTVFVKVAPIVAEKKVDPVAIDAANSLIVNNIPDAASWTVELRDVRKCDMDDENVATITDDEDATHMALAFTVIKGTDVSKTDKLAKFSNVSAKVRTLLKNLISTSIKTGFLHNDLHMGNVMMDANGDLRVIDYGRLYVNEATYKPYSSKVQSLLAMGNQNQLKAKWNPFREDEGAQFSYMYWTADLITLSMQLYTGIRKGRLGMFQKTKATFFKRDKKNDHNVFVPTFNDAADLKAQVAAMNPALSLLMPGLMLYSIMLKEISAVFGDNESNKNFEYAYPNFVLTPNGGEVLIALFEDATIMQKYGDALTYAFDKAGLSDTVEPAFARLTGQSGGAMDYFRDYEDVDEELDSAGMDEYVLGPNEKFFPSSMEEAAVWSGYMSVPDDAIYMGTKTSASSFAPIPMQVGITAGGGRKKSNTMASLALGAIVLVMSMLPR